ncbi:DUF2797 domain-containing protein [Glutamicibacter sp. AOP33-2CA-4]
MILERENRQLCHGISFSQNEPDPMLRLRRGDDWINEPLRENRSITLSVGETKFCLGYVSMRADGSRSLHPCPKLKGLKTGTQCDGCRRLDQSKFMHQFHKTGEAPEGLRKYLEQPHFLYVASFAQGATKVGTTSVQSKWTRLAQQGAVAARYVARAADGAAIRVLEDLVTEHVGLKQQIRQKSKVKGLTSWEMDAASLDAANASAARRTQSFLESQGELSTYGVELLDQRWEQPAFAREVIRAWDAKSLHPWAGAVPGSELNLRIRGVLGQTILVDSGAETTLRLLDAAELKTRVVSVKEQRGEFFEEQSPLF